MVKRARAICAGMLIFVLFDSSPGKCQDSPPAAPDTVVVISHDTYRLRIENAPFGRIEASVDSGEHFLIIGRVTKPARLAAPDKLAREAGTIIRSTSDGIAFAVAPGHALKILPAAESSSRSKPPDSAIVTDMKPRTGLFGAFLPPVGTDALQQVGHAKWSRYPDGLTPTEDTVFAFIVTLPFINGGADGASASRAVAASAPDSAVLARLAEVRKRLVELSDQYTVSALARAKETNRAVLSGVVSLRAKLPVGEPEPIAAVTYSIDGDPVSAQNTFPAVFAWDTTRVRNGEHVVEVRALSKNTTVITRVRTLVVVDNKP